jgi:REP element-mobilizing transposase RayT
VTSRGNQRRAIFSDDADRRTSLDILAQSAQIYTVEIHAHILMTNHFHLVVGTLQGNLSRFMQRFITAYAAYDNRRHRGLAAIFSRAVTRLSWWRRTATV